jgi:thymidylate kinase
MEIYIDIPAELSMERSPKYGINGKVENDRHEKNYKLLSGVRELYLSECKKSLYNRQRVVIDGTQTISEVSNRIWDYVKNNAQIF